MQGDRSIAGLIASLAMAAFALSLLSALYFAWFGDWKAFRAAYAAGWAVIAAAALFLFAGSHGTHGTPTYMLAWGLAYFLPFLILAAFVAGALASVLGHLGKTVRTRRAIDPSLEA